MDPLANVHLNRVLAVLKANYGFMNAAQLATLAARDPDRQVLVRCNLGRFLCRAADCKARLDVIESKAKAEEAAGRFASDWVRDVSLPATDPVWE